MALVVVLVLTWSTVASAARFGDYSGAKMPQYETGDHEDNDIEPVAEDYHGHSPDASLSHDYKYEEDTKYGNTASLERARRVETWQKSKSRRRDKVVESLDDHDADLDSDADTDAVHRRPSRKYFQRKEKLNNRSHRKEKNIDPRRLIKNEHEKNIREFVDNDDYIIDKEEFRNNKRKEYDEDDDERYTTKKVFRRKPRDGPRMHHIIDDPKEDLRPDRRIVGEELDYTTVNGGRRRRPTGTRLLEDRYRAVVDDDETSSENKQKKVYDENEDYYDMKRVENIKNKLPLLLRRTSVKTTVSTSSTMNVIDVLWTYRRADAPPSPSTSPGTTTSSSTETFITTQLAVNRTTANNSSQELSLAEKSRLSILKKAQRKESLKSGSSTNKPPVLLQVTGKMPTVIMVEPPSSEDIYPRAREFSEDTPERLNRAKLLMRKKLIGRARNIQDLTDNWDEVICDYIDVALLDAAPNIRLNNIMIVVLCLEMLLF